MKKLIHSIGIYLGFIEKPIVLQEVVSQFDDVVTTLHNFGAQCDCEIQECNEVLDATAVKKQALLDEAEKALRIKSKIADLIG